MSKYKKICGIFFSFLFLWLALRKIDFKAIPQALATINISYFALMNISYALEMLTRAHRWQIILSKDNLSYKDSFFGLILTYLFNNILPARAGEFFRPYYYEKKNVATSGESLGACVLERFFDGVLLMAFMLLSFQLFNTNDLLRKGSLFTAIFYGSLLVGILLAVFKRDFFEKIIKWFLKFLPQKASNLIGNLVHKFIDGLSTIKSFKKLCGMLISSLVCWLATLLTTWLCFKAFSFGEGFLEASFVMTVLSLSSIIPASPGNLGVFEFFTILTLTQVLTHSHESAAAFALVLHSVQYLIILISGITISFIEGIKIKDFVKPASPKD